jgi:hypothetical protein
VTLWEIKDETGKIVLLAPYFFEKNGGEGILAELRTHLPDSSFEDGFKVFKLNEQKGYWLKTSAVIVLTVAFLFFLLFERSTMLRSQLITAWEVEEKIGIFERSKKMLVDSRGGLWVLSEDIDQYFVYYWSESGAKQRIKLPEFQYQDPPRFLSGDESGNPMIWLDNRVVYYLNGEWQTVYYKNDLQLDFFDRTGIINGSEAWVIAAVEDRLHLIHLDGLTGEWFEVPLPESAMERGLGPVDTRPLSNGKFLVLMHDKEFSSFYVFSKNTWKTQEYSLPMNNMELFLMDDMYLDPRGNLFLLFRVTQDSWVVKKISSAGFVEITHLPPPKTGESDVYDEINVDTHGRLWVKGGSPFFMEVFQPQWGGTALELEIYTRSNSNFQAELYDSPILLPDGRLLSADDYVSSIDTSLLDLPKPLPAWFANVNKQVIGFFIMIIATAINYSMIRTARQKIKGEENHEVPGL